jgi:type I restriction enzyme R subunit
MCESFLKHAQRDPQNTLGKSIIFAVNQRHATELTKILNEMQPGIAVTITSRIPEAAAIAKEFRDGKRKERVAVSVDMLSTGYNCRDLLNVVLMRPVFSPTEYIQIKGRGTRRFTFRSGNTEYEKKHYFLLDYCGVAEYFEEQYDYSLPLVLPRPRASTTAQRAGAGQDASTTAHASTIAQRAADGQGDYSTGDDEGAIEIPIWQGWTWWFRKRCASSGRRARRWT